MVVRDSLLPVVFGAACGLNVALIAGGSRLIGVFGLSAYGTSPREPIAFVTAVAVLLLTAALTAFVPARRAAGIDPAEMLKRP